MTGFSRIVLGLWCYYLCPGENFQILERAKVYSRYVLTSATTFDSLHFLLILFTRLVVHLAGIS